MLFNCEVCLYSQCFASWPFTISKTPKFILIQVLKFNSFPWVLLQNESSRSRLGSLSHLKGLTKLIDKNLIHQNLLKTFLRLKSLIHKINALFVLHIFDNFHSRPGLLLAEYVSNSQNVNKRYKIRSTLLHGNKKKETDTDTETEKLI